MKIKIFALMLPLLSLMPKDLPNIDSLWNYSNPAQSESLFTALLEEYPGEGEWSLVLMTQLARVMGMQHNDEGAGIMLDRVQDKLKDKMVEASARYYLERGRLDYAQGSPDKALESFNRAVEFAKGSGLDMLYLDGLHMVAIVLPPEEGIEYNLKAMKYIEDSGNQQLIGWLGPLYNNTAWTYNDLGQYDKAMKLFLKDSQLRQGIGDDMGYLISLYCIGFTHRKMGNIDRALEVQEGLYTTIHEKKLPDDGYNLEELGELYLLKGDGEKAKEFFGNAYRILSKDPWLNNNEPERLERLRVLSEAEGE